MEDQPGYIYWAVVAGIVSGLWVVVVFARDRMAQAFARSSALVDRLLDGDKLVIENPAAQQFLAKTAHENEAYFRDDAVLDNLAFFKAKSLVYRQLNIFDEILAAQNETAARLEFLMPSELIELADWDSYFKTKLRHPLYRSILNNEGHIFGAALRDFWAENRQQIESAPPDKFLW